MSPRRGIVYLVGAGPGDPGLITVSGKELLNSADVVVYDRLASAELLEETPGDCERIDVGKRPGDAPVSQEEINAILIDRAAKGLGVVRLKGGDPFVFGRGFEELSACRKAAVDCVVIPGVSSALAAPLLAGIPLTLRGVCRSFAVTTAQTSPETDSGVDFAAFRGVDALIILMSRARLEEVAAQLTAAGWDRGTPVACIQQASTPAQEVVTGTLDSIANSAKEAGLSAPMVTVVGEIARFAQPSQLGPQDPTGPGGKSTTLKGKRILITRPRSLARKLSAMLARRGAVPIVCPLLRITFPPDTTSLDAAIGRLNEYNWVAFTSRHAVTAFWRRLVAGGFDSRRLSGCKFAALGFATASQLRRCGINADVTASSAAELASKVLARAAKGDSVLWPRGDKALPILRDALEQAGLRVEAPISYYAASVSPKGQVLDRLSQGFDAVLLYSPSAVAGLTALEPRLDRAKIVCIGHTTAQAAKEGGYNVDGVAEDPTDMGVLAQLELVCGGKVKV